MPCIYLILAGLTAAAAHAQIAAPAGLARARILEGPDSTMQIQINASTPISLNSVEAVNGISRDGVNVRAEPGFLWVKAESQTVAIDSVPIEGWTMRIPTGAMARLGSRSGERRILAESPGTNAKPLELELFDGAKALLKPASAICLEFFVDRTYSLRASTNVAATSADGLPMELSRMVPPMIGGELKEIVDARGATRFSRAGPVVSLEFSGAPGKEIQLKSPLGPIALGAGQERFLSFPNGGALMLRHDPVRERLNWRVQKGLFEFKLAGFSCWKALPASGQSGVLQWNSQSKAVDVSNGAAEDSWENALIVQLSGRVGASLAPGATLQYVQFQDCGSFTTAANGEVYLLDRETGEVMPVRQSMAFDEGAPAGVRRDDRRWTSLELAWSPDSRITLRGITGPVRVEAGVEQTFRFGPDEIRVSYLAVTQELLLRAEHGNFEVRFAFIPDFSLEIPEGAAVVLSFEHRRQLLSARSAPDSGASIRVVAQGRTYMFLSGTARITVAVGQRSFIPEASAAWIFFEGAGGESVFTSGPQPAPLISPTRFDVSRITQEPVSVIE